VKPDPVVTRTQPRPKAKAKVPERREPSPKKTTAAPLLDAPVVKKQAVKEDDEWPSIEAATRPVRRVLKRDVK
jgi:hypothetical protein